MVCLDCDNPVRTLDSRSDVLGRPSVLLLLLRNCELPVTDARRAASGGSPCGVNDRISERRLSNALGLGVCGIVTRFFWMAATARGWWLYFFVGLRRPVQLLREQGVSRFDLNWTEEVEKKTFASAEFRRS
jgi:hypothetical protein